MWADDDADVKKCLADFRALKAGIVSGTVLAPKQDEGDWVYTLRAERYTDKGQEKYTLTITNFEGGYTCKFAPNK